MVLTRPVTRTKISTATFGHPIYDATIRQGGTWRRNANQSMGNNVWTNISWDTEIADSAGFLATPGTIVTIPAGMGGVYAITCQAYIGYVAGFVSTVALVISGVAENITAVSDGVTGTATVSITLPLVAGATVYARVFQNSGVAINSNGRLEFWRVNI